MQSPQSTSGLHEAYARHCRPPIRPLSRQERNSRVSCLVSFQIMLLTDPEVESSLLISLDEGASYQKHHLAFDVLSLLFHPEQEDWILAYSHDRKVTTKGSCHSERREGSARTERSVKMSTEHFDSINVVDFNKMLG